jgi:pimeloyl-ACP methyl ester carboxylesterase
MPAQSTIRGLARVNGIDLAYQIRGHGDPLVLLHGGFGSVEMFGPSVAVLAAGRQVIGVDLQSHGRSPAANRPMTFEAMGDDIAALIRSRQDYDWTDEVRGLQMPVLIVAGDSDGSPPSGAAEFFALLGGGLRDAGWDGSGMTRHALAILPRVTHYSMGTSPALVTAMTDFLDR